MGKKLTKEEFINRAIEVHDDTFDYSKVSYVSYHTKVEIICKKHGIYEKSPGHHLSGQGCPDCSLINRTKSQTKTKEEFIQESIEVHGDKYDYSKVKYINTNTKVSIICRTHVYKFNQYPSSHLKGFEGCDKCKSENSSKRQSFTKEEFIWRAMDIHGDKYDYTNINFINMRTSIDVFCNFHQKTWAVSPYAHAKPDGTGTECRYCHGFGRTTEDFIEAAKQLHGNKYDYSSVKYTNAHSKVKVYCSKHDREWLTTWHTHIIGQHGCRSCGNEKNIAVKDVIARFQDIHGDLYDYSLYKSWGGWHKIIEVKCKKHNGHIFHPTPASHFYLKTGCDLCGNIQKSVKNLKPQEEFIRQAKIIHGDRFDYSKAIYKGDQKYLTIICDDHKEFDQRADHHLGGSGCTDCRDDQMREERSYSYEDFFLKANEEHLGIYEYIEETWEGYNDLITIVCPQKGHGEFTSIARNHAHGSGCTTCSQSRGEREVARFLINKNISYKTQQKFPDCKDKRELPFDFWIPDMNTLIEYDGEQHYKEIDHGPFKGTYKGIQRRDNIKNKFCIEAEITLLRIRWDQNINEELTMFFDAFQ